ncbi:MAG TPA: glycosyltransferase family A protein, partial [Cytophagales bacterium]|nr:glycosyltransferase family A protein [Cytophagales bacterium]
MSILISVVIPCYNHGKYITKAIQSVLEYEFPEEVEILVINDGSTDPETLKVLSELSDPHVQVYHQENKGLAKSRNRGVQLAQGRYILPLDSDNYIKHEYIGISKQILDARRDIDVVYCDRIIFNDHSNVYQKVPEYSLKEILFGNKIDACAVFRKSMWESLGGYDEFMPVMGYE